jgi:RTX calcium-binding nonapeptide repeat (4 copies)
MAGESSRHESRKQRRILSIPRAGRNNLHGGPGNDTIWGAGWQNTDANQVAGNFLSGENGNDRLYGGNTGDSMDGKVLRVVRVTRLPARVEVGRLLVVEVNLLLVVAATEAAKPAANRLRPAAALGARRGWSRLRAFLV